MSNPMQISVVIPFYKAERYFAECLDSILNQTFSAAEIIVVNDSPSAQSIAFLNQYKDVCRLVTLDRNHGVSHARNVGVKNARYEWIAFMDADDLWEPEKLALQTEARECHPEWSALHTGTKIFVGEKIVALHTDKPEVLTLDHVLVSGHVTPSSFILRKNDFDMLGGFDESMKCAEDYDLIIRLVERKFLIGFVAQPLVGVRRENQNNLSSNGKVVLLGFLALLNKHRRLFLQHGGIHVTRKFLGKALQISGGKYGGLIGKILYRAGQLSAWPAK